ncbi:MAG TPA: site-specific integrase [Streptosporangiaceae bacterium]|nr:site-specific integrase [Streptosporangiaceae bacterium]
MTARGRAYKRCGCKDPVTGRQLGERCPDLRKRHHGAWAIEVRIDTTARPAARLHRSGFTSSTEADKALERIRDLVRLADDDATRAKIGDLIFQSTERGGQLPGVETVRRRLALGVGPAGSGETFGQAWGTWLAGKRKLRPSSRRRLEQIGAQWLLPVLADVQLERLNAAHCSMVFDRVEQINDEIGLAAAEGRAPVLPDDVRTRPQPVGVASQHRIYAALREVLNYLWKQRHVIQFNAVYAVELEPEETPEGQRWTAGEAARFLAASAADPLGLMFRVVVLRGARRGEAVGFRWAAADLDAGYLAVHRPVLQLGGELIEGKAKSKAGARRIWLDSGTVALLRAHRKAQLAARLRASTAWQDSDLVFAREDGSAWPPDYVSRRFKEIARAAGLPVIKLHEGRHSAASLARDAGVDAKVRQEQLGHATGAMTDHYTHVLAEQHLAAAEAVARLVGEAGA